MKRTFQVTPISFIVLLFFIHNICAQDESSSTTYGSIQGLGNTYFVDEAGLQLLQTLVLLMNLYKMIATT